MPFAELIEKFSLKNLPHSEAELTGSVPPEAVARYRDEALSAIAKELELPGFRKGFVPPDMALKRVGELAVLEEAAERFIRDFYPELVTAKKLDVVGRPDIRITKLAPGNPLELVIRTALYPDIRIPSNWQRIAQNIKPEEAVPPTEKEVDEALEHLRKSRPAVKDGTEEVPELTDDFARSIGAFKDAADLRARMTEGMTEEKKRAARDKRRAAIIDALLEKTDIDLPGVFVESELEKMLAQMRDDVARFGLQFDDYLKRVGKTEEEMRAEMRESAAKRAKLQLMLNELAQKEKVEPDQAAVEEEMKHGIEHFPDAKPDLLRIHIETVLRNEKVLQLLESAQ